MSIFDLPSATRPKPKKGSHAAGKAIHNTVVPNRKNTVASRAVRSGTIHAPRYSGVGGAAGAAQVRAIFPKAQHVGTVKRQKVAPLHTADFYASRSAGQRKAMRDSFGVLTPKAAATVQRVHRERTLDTAGLLALARRANMEDARASHAAGSVEASVRGAFEALGGRPRPLTKLEAHGARVALKRAKRHGVSVAKVLAPYRTAHRQLAGVHGGDRVKVHKTDAATFIRQALDEQAGMSTDKLIRQAGGDPSKQYSAFSPMGVAASSPQKSDKFLHNFASDAVSLGEAPYVGGRAAFAATVAALHGNTKPAEQLASGVWTGLKASAPGELLQGHPLAASKAIVDHPLYEALNFEGLASGLGRLAGAGLRGVGSSAAEGGVRGALARAGSTERPSLALIDDPGAVDAPGNLVRREFSKSTWRKYAYERTGDARRQVLRDAHGNPVLETHSSGRKLPVLLPKKPNALQRAAASNAGDVPKGRFGQARASARMAMSPEASRLIAKSEDLQAFRKDAIARMERELAGKMEHRTGRLTRKGPSVLGKRTTRGEVGVAQDALLSEAVQGSLRGVDTLKEDLGKRISQIEDALRREDEKPGSVYRDAEEVGRARDLVTILKFARSPAFFKRAEQFFKVAERQGKLHRSGDLARVGAKTLTEAQAKRTPLIIYALDHMGAKHFTVEEHRALEAEALQAERAARKAYEVAPAGVEKAAAKARYMRARDDRIAVSGKNPSHVRAWEEAVGRKVMARRRLKDAGKRAERLSTRKGDAVVAAEREVRTARVRRDEARRRAAMVSGANRARRGSGRDVSQALRDKILSEGKTAEANVRIAQERLVEARARLAKAVEDQRAEAKVARAEVKKARVALRDAREKVSGMREPQTRAGVRTGEGRFLPTRVIEEHARSVGRDPSTIAYIPSRASVEKASSHYAPADPTASRPSSIADQTLTGVLHQRGGAATGRELSRDEIIRKSIVNAQARGLDEFALNNGIRHPAAGAMPGAKLSPAMQKIHDAHGLMTDKEAEPLIRELERKNPGHQYVTFSVARAKDDAAIELVAGESPAMVAQKVGLAELEARMAPSAGARNKVIVDLARVNRARAHLKPSGDFIKFFQTMNRPFRAAVLSLNPRWLAGDFIEPWFVRLPMSGTGIFLPGAAADLRALVKMDRHVRERGSEAEIRQWAAWKETFIGGQGRAGRRGADIHRTYMDYDSHWARMAGYIGHQILQLPIIKQVAQAIHLLGTGVLLTNRAIGKSAGAVGLGHLLRRQMQEYTGSYMKALRATDDALGKMMSGTMDSATFDKMIAAQHTLLGKYEGFSPWLRSMVQGPMPFIPWALAAAKFVYWTMPVHHTAAEALLIQTSRVVQKDWQDMHTRAGAIPGGAMQDNEVRSDGGFVDIGRYTPFGLTIPVVQGDLSQLPGFFAPQFSGAVQALRGQDPFGRQLDTGSGSKSKVSGGEKAFIALYSLAEALVPGLRLARSLEERGATPYADSWLLAPHTKPGTSHGSGLNRALNPFRPTYLKKKPSGGSSGGGGGRQVAPGYVAPSYSRQTYVTPTYAP